MKQGGGYGQNTKVMFVEDGLPRNMVEEIEGIWTKKGKKHRKCFNSEKNDSLPNLDTNGGG